MNISTPISALNGNGLGFRCDKHSCGDTPEFVIVEDDNPSPYKMSRIVTRTYCARDVNDHGAVASHDQIAHLAAERGAALPWFVACLAAYPKPVRLAAH